ncbi:MAG TPA: elongation factor P [bacterium]|nr:elongation factor P [bacterium]
MDAIDLKSGMIIEVDGSFYTVMSAVHTHAQQRRAVIRVKCKDMKSGKTNEFVWRSDKPVNVIYVEEMPLNYLFRDSSGFHFMNSTTYEQLTLPEEIVGDRVYYLIENIEVVGLVYNGKMLDIKPPIFIDLKVIETEPGFKGDTVQSAKKPAKLETGLSIQVPLFVNVGDTVRIDTRTNEYVTRL